MPVNVRVISVPGTFETVVVGCTKMISEAVQTYVFHIYGRSEVVDAVNVRVDNLSLPI